MLFNVVLFAAAASATAHNAAHNAAHQARSSKFIHELSERHFGMHMPNAPEAPKMPNAPETPAMPGKPEVPAAPAPLTPTPDAPAAPEAPETPEAPEAPAAPITPTPSEDEAAPKCDKTAILAKVTSVVPTDLVKTLLATPKPFESGDVPEFWSKFTDAEKQCLAILYPLQPPADSAAPAPSEAPAAPEPEECVESTVTTTSTVMQTVTVIQEPTASASADMPSVSATLSLHVASPSASMTAPWGNGTATQPTFSSAATGNVTSNSFLPEFTAGQGKVGVSFVATVLAVVLAVLV